MSKGTIIFISVLLISASIIIHVVLKDSNAGLDEELIGFIGGLCFGMGIVLPFTLFIKKKKS